MSLRVDIEQRLGDFTLKAEMSAEKGVTVIFGRSGSGKTSLINALAGLNTPRTGRISLNDRVLLDAGKGINRPPHQRRIGYVFQDARLFPHLSVARNLEFGARYATEPIAPRAKDRLINVLGISHLLERRPAALSGGEKQRVALGRAVLSAPDLLLLDEPLAALDETRKQEILPYLERLRADGGPPMIYVTHDMSEIVRLADKLVVMRDGTCVVQGLAEDVLADPANVKLIGVQDAGALIRGVLEHHAQDGLSAIRLSAGVLHVPKVDAPIGTQMRLRVRAQDVILSLDEPVGLSTQNIFNVQITDIKRGVGPSVAIALRAGSDRLLARITTRACTQMDLHTGQKLWAVLKANAVPPSAISSVEKVTRAE